jgi:GH24 family phage-related lysozyme (muramidase)
MHISERGLALVESFEGWSSKAYWDPWGKVWTIGYGETQGVHQGMVITRAEGNRLLREHMAKSYEPAVNGLGVPLNQNQFDALVSLVYNCGPGAMQWQIGVDLRARNYKAAANDFLRYVNAGGVRLQGLVNRRNAERTLFLTPVAAAVDPHHYDWYDHTRRQTPHGLYRESYVAQRYDQLRRLQTPTKHPNRAELATLRDLAGWFAARLATVAGASASGWKPYHRQWRHDLLAKRQGGARV